MADSDLRAMFLRYVEVINAHDFEKLREFLGDSVGSGGASYSPDQVIANFRAITDAVPDMHWEVKEILYDRDGMANRSINTGTPAKEWLGVSPTGRSFEIVEYSIYRVADGKFVQMTNMHDSGELRRQLAA